jgi:hypothetical protein
MSMLKNTSQTINPTHWFNKAMAHRGMLFTLLILTALLAFEVFNYSTTQYSLIDLLGPIDFSGIKWATILAIAFCGIDFAGIARLFTPEQGGKEPTEVWYLFGAWFLAATMNAILTWWGISIALQEHTLQSAAVIDPNLLLKGVPIFVAVMVWLIRIMIIGTLSYASDRLTYLQERPGPGSQYPQARRPVSTGSPYERPAPPMQKAVNSVNSPAPYGYKNQPEVVRPLAASGASENNLGDRGTRQEIIASRPEPVYQSLSGTKRPPTPQKREF